MDEPCAGSRRRPAAERVGNMSEVAKTDLPSPMTSPNASRRRALVVEAEPATLRMCRDVLESYGFVVDAVDSGIAALVAARQGLPELILMGLQLRDVPGREAIGWLRSNPALRATPIIVLTTAAECDADLSATRPGASLRKPLSPSMIQHTIREVLE
jgi:CheY-like chemotaxis protein